MAAIFPALFAAVFPLGQPRKASLKVCHGKLKKLRRAFHRHFGWAKVFLTIYLVSAVLVEFFA